MVSGADELGGKKEGRARRQAAQKTTGVPILYGDRDGRRTVVVGVIPARQ